MKSLEQLDRWIAAKVKRLSGAPEKRELLEIRRDILEDVRDHIEPKGGGKYIFPYNEIEIHLAPEDEHQQQRFEAALAGDEGLAPDIHALLVEAGCPIPPDFGITIVPAAPLFGVLYRNRKSAPQKPAPAARPAAKLIVTQGSAEPPELAIASNRVNLGRLKEVVGEKDGLRRRNDVAFAATETTVSREHAYIRYDSGAGKFRICDGQSARGVSIFREGRRIGVPRASARGVQLQAGDEIQLGDARIRFEIEGP